MPRRARDLERSYTRSQFVAKLRRLAAAIERRRPFTIQVASERLHIPAEAVFNIEHERSGGQDELEFQLRWKQPAAGAAVQAKRRTRAQRRSK
jgi:amphi-Trp domain-containing protein